MTKADFEAQIAHVQKQFHKRFDLLFWVVASHGGNDTGGEYFLTSDGERVHLYQVKITTYTKYYLSFTRHVI